jgi:DNA-directed RNA polymerase specialized sigma24 family protein
MASTERRRRSRLVQEAYLRAFKFFGGVRSDTGKPWLLRIVRNVCYDHLKQRQNHSPDCIHREETDPSNQPEEALQSKLDIAAVRSALANLPEDFSHRSRAQRNGGALVPRDLGNYSGNRSEP